MFAVIGCTARALPAQASPEDVNERAIAFDALPGKPFAGGGAASTRPALIIVTDELERQLVLEPRLATHLSEPTTATVLAALPLTDRLAIAAFAGPTATLGFGYAIRRIATATAGNVVLTADLARPSGDTVLPLVGHPYALASVARRDLNLPVGAAIELRDGSGTRMARTRWCGVLREGQLDRNSAPRQCVLAAYAAGDDAQLVIQRVTTEGAPVVWTVRAIPGGLSEVSLDVRRDPLRARDLDPVSSWACTILDRGGDADGRGSLRFSGCTGNGSEVAVP